MGRPMAFCPVKRLTIANRLTTPKRFDKPTASSLHAVYRTHRLTSNMQLRTLARDNNNTAQIDAGLRLKIPTQSFVYRGYRTITAVTVRVSPRAEFCKAMHLHITVWICVN